MSKSEFGKCPRCGHRINGGKAVIKKGPYGTFLGCSTYPKCRYTESLKNYYKRRS